MKRKCLEDLESSKIGINEIKEEVIKRFYSTISIIDGLTFESACYAQESLILCGYTYFEALYLICGDKIKDCTLLSERTSKLIQKILLKKESDELKETWKNKLEKMIDDLDEKTLIFYLKEDSKKLNIILSNTEKENTLSRK